MSTPGEVSSCSALRVGSGSAMTRLRRWFQEALLRLWQSLAQGDRVTEPSAWTFRATYRLAMDRHRWQRRWQRLVEAYSTDHGDRVAVAEPPDDGLAVWAEVDRLPPRQRAAVYLRYRADLDFEAVGRVLGIDASSARGNVARGVAKIRARLAAPEECAEVAR